jgi:RimJ/RimL family protein N-acetyltransferase
MDRTEFKSIREPVEDASAAPRRWGGVLNKSQIKELREKRVPIAFDPVQIGWVAVQLDETKNRLGWRDPQTPLSWKAGRLENLLHLRKWRDTDAATYRKLLNDPAMWQYMPEAWPGEITEDMARDLIAISTSASHHEVWAVQRGAVSVGQVRFAFGDLGANPHEAEISYWLGRPYWGQGIGKALIPMATKRGFTDHPAWQRITAIVHPENSASARILEDAGYSLQSERADGWRVFEIRR